MLNALVDLVLQESKMDNIFFVCVGFAIYALVSYGLNMLGAYREYKELAEWLSEKDVEISSLDKHELSKYLSIFRLSEIDGVEIVSIDEPK